MFKAEDIENMISELPEKALRVGVKVLLVFFVFIIGMWLIKVIRKILNKALTKAKADIGVNQFLDSFVKAVLYVILAFIIANYFGLQAASIVAIIGSAGVAIGLALQGSLSNLAGGVLILLMKPFHVGDYIKEDSHGNEGTVKEISLFYTKLTTVDNKVVILPNGALANNSMTNYTTSKKRRVDLTIGISYNADILLAKNTIMEILKEQDKTIEKDGYQVFVDNLGSSEVTIGARCWVKTDDYFTVRWSLIEQIKNAFDEKEIEIPFSQMDVHIIEDLK